MLMNILRVGVRRIGPDFFQWWPATGQGAMGTNWSSIWTRGRTSSLWGWHSTGTGCPERLWSLLLWRYSRLTWRRSCAACCRWTSFGRGVGPDALPTPTILWFCDSVGLGWHSMDKIPVKCTLHFKCVMWRRSGVGWRRSIAFMSAVVVEQHLLALVYSICCAFLASLWTWSMPLFYCHMSTGKPDACAASHKSFATWTNIPKDWDHWEHWCGSSCCLSLMVNWIPVRPFVVEWPISLPVGLFHLPKRVTCPNFPPDNALLMLTSESCLETEWESASWYATSQIFHAQCPWPLQGFWNSSRAHLTWKIS